MSRARSLVVTCLALTTSVVVLVASACYDVDGLRGGTRDGGEALDARAPEASEPGPSRFCATVDAAFCDDFDDGVPLEEKWHGRLAGRCRGRRPRGWR